MFVHQDVLPDLGTRKGKGEALWKSMFLTRGDIVIWVDTDIANFHPRFVYGLLGPLITHPEIQFVKGFYRRPLKVDNKLQAGGGGRVTELTARPLLNLFFPELSGIIQPLSGEYGGRRTALEQLAFSSGYGVEIGLLIDIFEKFGLDALAQVDLPGEDSPQSAAGVVKQDVVCHHPDRHAQDRDGDTASRCWRMSTRR